MFGYYISVGHRTCRMPQSVLVWNFHALSIFMFGHSSTCCTLLYWPMTKGHKIFNPLARQHDQLNFALRHRPHRFSLRITWTLNTMIPGINKKQVLRPLIVNLGHQHSKTRQMTLQVGRVTFHHKHLRSEVLRIIRPAVVGKTVGSRSARVQQHSRLEQPCLLCCFLSGSATVFFLLSCVV